MSIRDDVVLETFTVDLNSHQLIAIEQLLQAADGIGLISAFQVQDDGVVDIFQSLLDVLDPVLVHIVDTDGETLYEANV